MQIDDLTAPEKRLWEAFPSGKKVDLCVCGVDENDPKSSRVWGPERSIRASVIAELLMGHNHQSAGRSAGVHLVGAHIVGMIDLDHAEFQCHLRLKACRVSEPIRLYDAHVRQITVVDSALSGLDASSAQIDGNLNLGGSRVRGEVKLVNTHVMGYLQLGGAQLRNPTKIALNASRLRLENDLSMHDGFQADGEVTIRGARIKGEVCMEHAVLRNPGQVALRASRAEIGSNVLAHGLVTEGEVNLSGTRVGGLINFANAQLSNPSGNSLTAYRTETSADFRCSGDFRAEGKVHITEPFPVSMRGAA